MSRTAQRYARELLKLCAGKTREEVARVIDNFARLLLERRQGSLLPEILEAVEEAPEPGAVEVTMTTATPIDAKAADGLKKGLEKKIDAPVHVRTETDPALLGGAMLRYGDVLFDGSLRGRLNALKRQLSQ